MTRKLYYEDCHLARFTARVVRCEGCEKGYYVNLDQTAFYPEGGGQACDLGTLAGIPVLDVRERGEDVIHLCAGPLEVGSTVEGVIDYERRFDLMQQHSGEHIVSGVVHEKFGYHNVGFHMGSEVITIDFDGPIAAEDLPVIEAKVNEAVWKNIPLRIWYPSPEELPAVGYRTKRELPWPVRIVEVPGYDKCACCGVHVACTGEIGLVKLFSVVKFHQGVRIEMACGRRALEHLSAVYDQNRQVSQAFSARILETGAAARQMNELLAKEKYIITGLQRQLFEGIAKSYANRTDVVHFESGLEPALVRELADRIADFCNGFAAVFSDSGEAGYSFCLVTREGDLRPLGREMTQALDGRGGGKPNFQQGRVNATEAQIRAFFENH
ncbi:MAG: alanyl-tRNA editing protein [Oscillospiraceae bacterium]|nr:alanyl-tRNA editing protein [Oscillospiraceae bacterium]